MALYLRRDVLRWLPAVSSMRPLVLGRENRSVPATYDDDEAYEVYSTLIPRDWIWTAAKADSLVIAQLTAAPEVCLEPDGKSAKRLAPAVADLRRMQSRRWLLQPRFNLTKPYMLVPQSELDAYFKEGGSGWDDFYARYPKSGGYMFFSPVGFNQAKDVAVVQVNHWCGQLCGGGEFFVLEKTDGEWRDLKWSGTSCGWAS